MAVSVAAAAGNVAAGTVAAVRSPARVVVQMKRRTESYNNACFMVRYNVTTYAII